MNTSTITVILLFSCSLVMASCGTQPDRRKGKQEMSSDFNGKYRPQYHFTPLKGWMNDPNGLVYFEGEYHLFYQYYPDSTVWGPMHWGHAVSTDLIHWQHLPVALYPDSLGYIFSGSAVVGQNNTSQFGTDKRIPLVAIFTLHNPVAEKAGSNTTENEGIAFSTDRGRSWLKYPGNPVLKNPGFRDFRDPKVFWYGETGKWIMILAVHDRVHLYSSPDLKEWNFESEFGVNAGAHGGVWECPDLFPLKVEGKDITKWVMLVSINPGGPNGGSATQYFTGGFDGHVFTADDTSEKWIDYGPDNYAGVTWSDIPESDGRRLFIGWMSNWNYATVVPATTWRSAMTLPRELTLMQEDGRSQLRSVPVKELETLRISSKTTGFQHVENSKKEKVLDDSFDMNRCELEFEFDLTESIPDTIELVIGNDKRQNITIGLSSINKNFFIDRRSSGDTSFNSGFARISTAPYTPGKTLKLRVFLDTTSAEMFVDDGKLVMTNLFFPSEGFTRLRLYSVGSGSLKGFCKFYELDRIW